MADGGSQGIWDWQSLSLRTGNPSLDAGINGFNGLNRWGAAALFNALGVGQAADANAGKRDQDGFLVPGFGATTTTGRVVKQEDGTYRVPVKDLKTGTISWRRPTAQEEAYAGVDSKTSKADTTASQANQKAENRYIEAIDRQTAQQGVENKLAQDTLGYQIQQGNNNHQLLLEQLRSNATDAREGRTENARQFNITSALQAQAYSDRTQLERTKLQADLEDRKLTREQNAKSNRLNAIMGLSAALAQSKF